MFLWCCHHDQSHCESSPGSSDECRLSAGWPPNQSTWAVSPPKLAATVHIHHIAIAIITQPVS